jgi:Nif-specific regulatory protein
MASGDDPFRLTLLLDLNVALATLDIRTSLRRVLEVLTDAFGGSVGMITLLDPDEPGRLRVEASCGLSQVAIERARYRVGEGITGRVVSSGRQVVVPKVSEEPLFLDRTGMFRAERRRKAESSFLCVPVFIDAHPVGALGIGVRYEPTRDFERDGKVLQVAASMVGQAVKVARLASADRERLMDENRLLRSELRQRYELPNLVGTSHAMQQVYEAVGQAAPAVTTVLIRGESGTGKEMIAHAIHVGSPRASGPFIKVSCGALPESLIESELFGYEPGAFTDARGQKKGRFELADGGTLFLDEIGELTPATQVKLLRVLQEREFERLGGVAPVRVDVRVIAATNRDLESATRAGTFREDLYYRLNVFEIYLPPLRERKTDIPMLADHFVQKYAASHGREVRLISTSAIDMLMAYHWPGNVRELENCIERAILISEGGVIHAHHLPPTLQTAEVSGTLPQKSLADAVAAYERDLLQDALKSARGNRARAARLLQTTERIFNYKIGKHGLDAERFRTTAAPPATNPRPE